LACFNLATLKVSKSKMITFLVLLSSQVSVLHATEYSYQPGSFTWEEARDHCAFLGMKIAFIKDARQNAEIGRHMPQEQNSWAWIGNPGNTGQNVYSNFLPNRGVPGNAHPCARIFSKVWNSYDDKWHLPKLEENLWLSRLVGLLLARTHDQLRRWMLL